MTDPLTAAARGIAPAACLAILLALGCGSGDGETASAPPTPSAGETADAWFTEVSGDLGIPEPPAPWPDATFAIYENAGIGVGFLDYDGDGDLDLYHARFPAPGRFGEPAPNRLYRQEADGRFVDVSEESGLDDAGYGQTFAVGDVDEDGDLDLYVANYDDDAFYRNNGDGTFTEATAEAGLGDPSWSASAAFCDYDQDGDLDLYVVHYLNVDHTEPCLLVGNQPDFCGPRSFGGVPDTLWRNEGGGSFRDVTDEVGMKLDKPLSAKGLGVVCTDLTMDGRPDFYVANDGEPNQLWVNQGQGLLADEAHIRGAAVNMQGQSEASMGLAVGDVNADGHLDLFMSHLYQETNTLYLGTGGPVFSDQTSSTGMPTHDLNYTGFGCGFLDVDLDGDLDIAVANGRVRRFPVIEGCELTEFWQPYAEPNLLFENDGSGRFLDVSERAGPFAARIEVSRGMAFGDYDDDGDVDIAVANLDQRLRVFRNDAPRAGRHWVALRLMEGPRESYGAQVRVTAGGVTHLRAALVAYSYQASNDPRVHVGLGETDRVDGIEVLWPDGSRETFAAEGIDREIVLRKGEGDPR